MKKFAILIPLFFILCFSLNAQNNLTPSQFDSLNKLLASPTLPDTTRCDVLFNIGAANQFVEPHKAIQFITEALTLARKINNKGRIYGNLVTLGYLFASIGESAKSIDILQEALRFVEDLHEDTSLTLAFIANGYEAQGDIANAISYNRKSFLQFEKRMADKLDVDMRGYAAGPMRMGQLFEKANQLDSAMYYAQMAFKRIQEKTTGWESAYFYCQICNCLGKIHSRLNEKEQALHFYRLAYSKATEVNFPSSISDCQSFLSEFYFQNNQPDSVIFYATQAYTGAKPLKNFEIMKTTATLLRQVYEKQGKFDKALFYNDLAIAARDSVTGAEKVREVQSLTFKEEQRQQKILQDAEDKLTKNKLYALLGFIAGLFLLAIYLFRNNRQKHKVNVKLQNTLEELKTTQEQLVEKEKIATDAATRLKELDIVKTRLYTNITHEFRTPLTVILGVTQNVQETLARSGNFKSSPNVNVDLSTIKRNGQNLLTLVNQMLDLNKLESGALTLNYRQGDIVTYIKYLAESFHSLAENKNLVIQFHSDEESFVMDFDETRLQQVVSNLLTNAIKFTPERGRIDVTLAISYGQLAMSHEPSSIQEKLTAHSSQLIALKVKDTGIGISESALPHIFDRFYQADTSATRHGEGTGIGLALTQELVKLMDGTIDVKSVLGEGTEFTVELPIRRDNGTALSPIDGDKAVPLSQHSSNLLGTPLRYAPNRLNNDEIPTILIADDNADVRIYITTILASEYNLIFASNGQEAEDMAFEQTPDLIISDVMMPLKDGFEVCKILKSDERTSHIPIIMLTAKADMDSKLQGLGLGADVYLMKPFYKEELLIRIKKLLELRKQLQKYYLSVVETRHALSPNDLSSESLSETNLVGLENLRGLDSAFVQKVKTTIEAHLNDFDLDVEKLSRAVGLSESQLQRKLHALTGLSVNLFIRYIRLIKAKDLLLNSPYSINAIAYDCGFNDPSYFARIFKHEFSLTPNAWREQNT